MSAWQFAKAQHVAEKNGWTKFISMQNHYNVSSNISHRILFFVSSAYLS
jgi:aryl-alcohol dehydrogenase-like predicted oxidoreductase